MDNTIKFRNCGIKHIHDFPNSDEVLAILNDGEIAYVKDIVTEHEYILTKQLSHWTMIDLSSCLRAITKKHMEKVYEVEFIQYTNCMRDTVSDGGEIGKTKYINVGNEPFLIKESEFDKYMKFGKGFRIVRFVGNMEV